MARIMDAEPVVANDKPQQTNSPASVADEINSFEVRKPPPLGILDTYGLSNKQLSTGSVADNLMRQAKNLYLNKFANKPPNAPK